MKHVVFTLFSLLITCDNVNGQWSEVYQTDSCNCPLFPRNLLTGMAFFGRDSGVVCSSGGNVKETAATFDGGLTWHNKPLDSSVFEAQGAGSFTDINHIWFCYKGFVYYTNDAGKTWEIDTNRDTLGYTAKCIYFVDSLVGYEGGAGQFLFRTSDGGKNWNLVNDSTNGDGSVFQIKFCNPKLGLAICGQLATYVLRTTDSGKTWRNLVGVNSFFAGLQPTSLSYPDPHNAWFTNGSYIYHSTDSGLTWNPVGASIPLGEQFSSISFVDSVHGIATASDPRSWTYPLIIGYTSNGGKSWLTTSIDSASSEGFTSFPDTNTAYVGGLDAVYKLNFQELAVKTAPVIIPKMHIYPNPVSDELQITGSEPGTVHLFDLLGRERMNTVTAGTGATLDVSHLEAGMYFLRLGNESAKVEISR